jgi:hypothetical protein
MQYVVHICTLSANTSTAPKIRDTDSWRPLQSFTTSPISRIRRTAPRKAIYFSWRSPRRAHEGVFQNTPRFHPLRTADTLERLGAGCARIPVVVSENADAVRRTAAEPARIIFARGVFLPLSVEFLSGIGRTEFRRDAVSPSSGF